MGWAWLVAHMGERRNMYWVFEGKPAGWRPLVRPKCSQEESIKMGVKKIGWGHGLFMWLRIWPSVGLLCTQ